MSDYWQNLQEAIDNLPPFEPHEKAWQWDIARAFQVPAEMLEQIEPSTFAATRLARDVWLHSLGLMTSAERQAHEANMLKRREYENEVQAEIYRWQVIDYDMPWWPYWPPKVWEGETK
jgi:hypothetical protein